MAWSALFAKSWKVLSQAVKKHGPKLAKKYGPLLIDWVRRLAPKVLDWWNGKKIAVIGPTAVGKNCLYHRLRGEVIPDDHHQTKSPERMPRFAFKRSLPSGKEFQVTFSRCTNVGGELEQRTRYWLDTCRDADVIFYMMTLDDLRHGKFRQRSRIHGDLKWLASHMGQLSNGVVVHLLVNKIDLELEDGDGYKEFVAELQAHIDELEATAKAVFGDYHHRLTGISPTSIKDDHIFALSFPRALESVYEVLHQR